MTKWTLVARKPNKPPERGLVAIDLIFDGQSQGVLRFSDVVDLEAALGNALTKSTVSDEGRFSCLNIDDQFVVKIDGVAVSTLSRADVELLRSQLNQIQKGAGSSFVG